MFWKVIGIGMTVIAGVSILSVGGTILGTITNVAVTQPGRIINKTFDADNVINNYEWYRDQSNSFIAKQGQVKGHKAIIVRAKSEPEISRLTIELAAMQQSCRDLAGRYNSNASKINRNIFMGTSVPERLNMGDCE